MVIYNNWLNVRTLAPGVKDYI